MGSLDAKQTRIVIVILCAVVLLVAYKFGYSPLNEKTEEVITENEELNAKLAELENVRDNAEQFRTELAAAVGGIDAIKQKFAAGITPQKCIMAMRELEKAAGAKIETIGFTEAENIYTSTFTNEAGEPAVANKSQLTITYSVTYEGLKQCIDFINGYGDYMNLNGITLSYNQETGLLMGNMMINTYSLTGLGKVYEDPEINGIGLSKDNIFGTTR